MAKYKIWVDEQNSTPRIANSKDEAMKIFDEETKRANEMYNVNCMTIAEMVEEEAIEFDDLITMCDFVYCEKIKD